jgi:methylglutaconyl-CoA hydratase
MSTNVLMRIEHRIATITLDRPDQHNAFDDQFIADMTNALTAAANDTDVRVVLIAANGTSFSAGADLNWMRRIATQGHAENLRDARALARMLQSIAQCPKPVIACVQGPAYGGGLGIVAACDIAVAVTSAEFALTEVRLGIIPAAISPYVIAAIGERQARRYMLTAERFSAQQAHRLGLIHELAQDRSSLESTVARLVDLLLANGPQALCACKALIDAVARRPHDDALLDETAIRIADIRGSPQAQEGMLAFLEKRKPSWAIEH